MTKIGLRQVEACSKSQVLSLKKYVTSTGLGCISHYDEVQNFLKDGHKINVIPRHCYFVSQSWVTVSGISEDCSGVLCFLFFDIIILATSISTDISEAHNLLFCRVWILFKSFIYILISTYFSQRW